tara:strand:- start:1446 stop:2045 length:600 start_codon:yes stop_codon:yes gene_type:complete
MSDKKYNIWIGIDVGLQGGITIFDGKKQPKVYRMPVESVVVRKKKKNRYNLHELTKLLKPYVGKDVLVYLEKQNPRPGEGSVSSFTAGTGFGSLKGMCIALGFDLEIVLPTRWKKNYPELESQEVTRIRDELDKLKMNKAAKNGKVVKKLKDQLKAAAKDAARDLASTKYKKLTDEFKLKRDDGKAESLLIALYAKNNQ